MNLPLFNDLLLIEGQRSFLLVGKATRQFTLYLETTHAEIEQPMGAEDIVVVSAPEGGPLAQAVLLMNMVRTYHMPLVVLPRGHPGSRHLSMVVSAGPSVEGACAIQRGTHPEQHLICTSEELAGVRILGISGGVEVRGLPEEINLRHLDAEGRSIKNNNTY